MNKSNKLIGRVSVIESQSGNYKAYSLYLRAKAGEFGEIRLNFTAQASLDYPDYAYAFKLDNSLRFDDYSFSESLALLGKLQKLAKKQEAPRAVAYDGKAYLSHCELSQFLMACEKLGLHVSRFSESSKAYDWVADFRSEEKAGAA